MANRILVITSLEPMANVFTQSLRMGDIEACEIITDLTNFETIKERIEQTAPDWICIDPYVLDNGVIDYTHLIKEIKKAFPEVKILAFAFPWKNSVPGRCHKQGADAFLTYKQLTVSNIRQIFERPVSPNKLIITGLRLIPQPRIMELVGGLETTSITSQATVKVPQPALWRMIFYLALERHLGECEWLVRWDIAHDYSVMQGAIWETLEIYFPPHQRYAECFKVAELNETLVHLKDQPRRSSQGRPLGPLKVPAAQAAVDVNSVNDLVRYQSCDYAYDCLIKGPPQGRRKQVKEPLCYKLCPSIQPKNVDFVDGPDGLHLNV
ncbi:MAG TPA: hypothetical protein VFM05_01400 [Candidatus Saccharimonadales bacterium]|nr:hypothetical protein [Candidatus Saccharimonadales bacterium]